MCSVACGHCGGCTTVDDAPFIDECQYCGRRDCGGDCPDAIESMQTEEDRAYETWRDMERQDVVFA